MKEKQAMKIQIEKLPDDAPDWVKTIKISLMFITPEWAAKALLENKKNRPMTAGQLKRLKTIMEQGKFTISNDMICFSILRLLNGQHRLEGVVSSGVGIWAVVATGLPDDCFLNMDQPIRRSCGHALSQFTDTKQYCRLAAGLGMVKKYMTGQCEKSVNFTNSEIVEIFEEFPDMEDYLVTQGKTQGFIFPSVIDSCNYLFSQKDTELAKSFVEKIIHGTGLEEGHPWHALRQRLIQNSLSKAKLGKPYMMALCIKAWNAARQGKPIYSLKYGSDESFPIIR